MKSRDCFSHLCYGKHNDYWFEDQYITLNSGFVTVWEFICEVGLLYHGSM